ncbi:MAG: CRISPR-associated endonuclease Cas1 [Chloracidobacterium sp.]|nr:CRISPR-associated endonuclease Cas1 [Chloracidobacterium sp.]MDW8216847.1 CRISPR-associated endonuclease Cas1 [Acidobacteriota bacterium]
MTTLYLTEQNTTLHKRDNRFALERDGRVIAEVHDFQVERVVVFGHIQLSTAAISHLLASGIDTTFVTVTGRFKGRLAALESKNAPLRARQFERVNDPVFKLALAKTFVQAKVANGVENLARQQRNHPELNLGDAIDFLSSVGPRIERAADLDELRGVEGNAAAVYFKALGSLFRRGFTFEKRTRRPPTDPVNALLSFGYSLLLNEAVAAVAGVGLDPYFGFLHEVLYSRCSLALDLIEEFRPITADRLAINMVNLAIVELEDFIKTEEGGVLLNDEARKRFLYEYERLMTREFTNARTKTRTTLRRALYEQAEALQKTILDGTPYLPFRGWH